MWNEQEEEDAVRFMNSTISILIDILKVAAVGGLVYFIWSCGN